MQSIVRSLNEVKSAQRWDFDYHDPDYLDLIGKLDQGFPTVRFGDIITLLTDMGAFSLYKTEYFVEKEEGVPFLRVQNVQEYGVDLTKDTKYISKEYHQRLEKSQLRPGDLLLTTKAVIGVSAVVDENLGECNMSQNLVRIHVKEGINPYYVSVFLNSRLGRTQTETAATGPNQKYLNFERIRDLKITLPPRKVQDRIAHLMQEAYATRQAKLTQLQKLLNEIDKAILSKLGIEIESFVNKKHFMVNISKLKGHRFDIGPYSNNFDLERISVKAWVSLQDLAYLPFTSKIASRSPDTEFIYVGMADVDDVTGEVNLQHLSGQQINSNKVAFKGGDIVFARIEPCIYNRKVAMIPYEVEEGLGSTELYVARAKEGVLPEFLLWILRSELIQQQISGYMTGTTGRRRLPPKAFANLKIPKVSKEMQNQVVKEAISSRDLAKQHEREAEYVVAEAKARVERMILGEEEV